MCFRCFAISGLRLGRQLGRQVDWQLAAAFAGLALFGLRSEVWIVGTLSQAYPLCLLLVVGGVSYCNCGGGAAAG